MIEFSLIDPKTLKVTEETGIGIKRCRNTKEARAAAAFVFREYFRGKFRELLAQVDRDCCMDYLEFDVLHNISQLSNSWTPEYLLTKFRELTYFTDGGFQDKIDELQRDLAHFNAFITGQKKEVEHHQLALEF